MKWSGRWELRRCPPRTHQCTTSPRNDGPSPHVPGMPTEPERRRERDTPNIRQQTPMTTTSTRAHASNIRMSTSSDAIRHADIPLQHPKAHPSYHHPCTPAATARDDVRHATTYSTPPAAHHHALHANHALRATAHRMSRRTACHDHHARRTTTHDTSPPTPRHNPCTSPSRTRFALLNPHAAPQPLVRSNQVMKVPFIPYGPSSALGPGRRLMVT